MASREEVGTLVASATLDTQQFQTGVSNLKRQLAVAKSEFKAASASLGSFGDATEQLKVKSNSLSDQISIQQKIVDELSAAHKESADAKGADAKQTQQLAIRVNQAKTALYTMQDQLKGVNMELEQNAAGMNAAGAAAERAGLQQKSFSEHIQGTKDGIESTKLAMAGMMGIMAGGMLAEWSDGAEKMAISLQRLRAQTGESQQELERLAVVASGSGVSIDTLSSMIGHLDKTIQSASTPSKTFLNSLDSLGISAQKFSQSSLTEQAQLIASAMEKSNLPTKQLASTLKGLGITASDLGKNMSQNLQTIQSALQKTADTSSTLGRAFTTAGINFQAFANSDTAGKIQILGKYLDSTKNKGQATALIMQAFGKSGAAMLPLIENFSQLDAYAKQLKMPVMDTSEIELSAEKTKMLQTAMQMMMDSVLVKLLPLVDKITKAFYDLAANIQHPGEAIRDFVKEMGPVPALITAAVTALAAMRVYNGVVGTLTAFKNSIMAAATTVRILKVATNEETGAQSLQFAGWIKSTASVIANTAAKVASTAATLAMSAATKLAAIAQAAFNAVMDANPVMLVVLAIAALAVGIYELVKHWKDVTQALSAGWNWIRDEAVAIWNGISAFFKKWGLDILVVVAPFIGLPLLMTKHWSQITAWFSGLWDGIKSMFHSVLTWLYENTIGRFESIANGVGGAMNGLHNRMLGIWDGIKNAMKAAINFMISGINVLIRALDKLHFSFPKWVPGLGGQSFGIDIPQVPYLATGAILTKPTLNVAGEDGPEAMIPLSGANKMAPFARAIAQELGGVLGGSTADGLTVVLQIDGQEFARVTAPHMDHALQRQKVIKLRMAGK